MAKIFKNIKEIEDGDVFVWNENEVVAVGRYVDETIFLTNRQCWNKEQIYYYSAGAFETIPESTVVVVIDNMRGVIY